MTEIPSLRGGSLEAILPQQFRDGLTEAEHRLLHAIPCSQRLYYGPGKDDNDPDNDPSKAQLWGAERSIRAELIRWVCTDRNASANVPSCGIQVDGARITGRLDLSFANVAFPLFIERCSITDQPIIMTGVRIPALSLNGSVIQSLLAEELITGLLSLQKLTAEARGGDGVRLIAAEVGGTLNCEGATFSAESGCVTVLAPAVVPPKALNADRIKVEGGVFLRYGFSAKGEVGLSGAKIRGDLSCRGGRFSNPCAIALGAENATVGGNVILAGDKLAGEFRADGKLDLAGIRVERTLFCRNGKFDVLNLTNASVGALVDGKASWPEAGNLFLDGFVYERISDSPMDAAARLGWLELQKSFTPQPYRQLAKVLRDAGDDQGSKQVLYELEKRKRAADGRGLFANVSDWMLKNFVGYGIYPEKAVGILAGFVAVGTLLNWRAHRMRTIVPTDKDAYKSFRDKGPDGLPPQYPRFSAFVYSLESCLQVLRLGMADRWQPDPNPQEAPTLPPSAKGWTGKAKYWAAKMLLQTTSPVVLRWFRLVFMICLGWLLTFFFVAAVANVLKAD